MTTERTSSARPSPIANWARSVRWRPRAIVAPRSEPALAEAVRAASAAGRRVRALGSAHAWTDAAATSDLQVSMRGLRRVRAIDAERRLVRVEGGCTLRELNEALHEHGLALPNLGSIAGQTVAGAIAMGTHGTGARLGNLSTFVEALRLVTASGEVLPVSATDNAGLLPAARLSLGALGIVSEVTMRVVAAYRVREQARLLPLDELVAALDGAVEAHERVKVWWLPHTTMGVLFTYERTHEPAALSRAARLGRAIDHSEAMRLLFTCVLRAGARWPRLVPTLNRAVARAYFRPRVRVDESYRILNIPMPPKHLEVEYAVPRAVGPHALEQLAGLVDDERLRVGFPLELRWVAADDLWLSPCYEQASCMIVCGMPAGSRDLFPWFAGYERVMTQLRGRPHWGKAFTMAPSALARAFPRLADFERARRALDPHDTFQSPFVERIVSAVDL